MAKVYMAIPFEAYQGHHADMARFFSTKAAASAYCEKKQAEDGYLDWEVEECVIDEEV